MFFAYPFCRFFHQGRARSVSGPEFSSRERKGKNAGSLSSRLAGSALRNVLRIGTHDFSRSAGTIRSWVVRYPAANAAVFSPSRRNTMVFGGRLFNNDQERAWRGRVEQGANLFGGNPCRCFRLARGRFDSRVPQKLEERLFTWTTLRLGPARARIVPSRRSPGVTKLSTSTRKSTGDRPRPSSKQQIQGHLFAVGGNNRPETFKPSGPGGRSSMGRPGTSTARGGGERKRRTVDFAKWPRSSRRPRAKKVLVAACDTFRAPRRRFRAAHPFWS